MTKQITTPKKILIAVLLLIALMWFVIKPLAAPGFFPMHDNEQVGRLFDLDQALKAGHIPPRIAPNLGFGYGYPFFNFYPSFVYYVSEIFHVFGFSYILATKMMIATGFVVTAMFMYLFARKYLNTLGAVAAAVAYTYAPYHAVDVYVRGALPEFWAFAFVPALFWSLFRLHKSQAWKDVILVGSLTALLILTHNLVAFMSAIFLGLYILYLAVSAENKKKFLTLVFSGVVLGLCLSAYFWIPSYFEKNYTMIELLTKDLADYRQHFVYFRQFWDSPWGYGGSLYGLYDGLSFEIGKLYIIGVVLAGAGLFLGKKQIRTITGFFIVCFAIAVYLASFHSQFIWDHIQPLSYIQFPWRFLLFTAFFSSFLVGVVISYMDKKYVKFLGIACIFLFILIYKDNFHPEKYLLQVTDKEYITPSIIRWDTSKLAAEYVPKGIATRKTDVGTLVVDIDKSNIAKQSYTVVSGTFQSVRAEQDLPQKKVFTVEVTKPGIFRINTYSFPGWTVAMDRKQVRYSDNNKYKLITVSVPVGKHSIVAEFKNTLVRSLGNGLTILGLLVILCVYSYSVWKRPKR